MKKLAAASGVLFMAFFVFSCGGGGDATVRDDATGGGDVTLESGAPTVTADKVTFVNNCAVSLTLHSTGPALGTLAANGGTVSVPVASFHKGGPNLVIPYPNTTTTQCPDAYCDGWTALGGAPDSPDSVQRQGFMWDPPNDTYAAYCNPSLSGRGICALQRNCSGPGMIQDGTFGTHWEFTPGSGGNDYVNLSTNYGSGPNTPPNLCPTGGGNDCVEKAAVIFFNVPVKWTTNQSCSFTTAAQTVTGLQCLTANCADAYKHPTDDKQCACPSSTKRGYRIEFCPAGSRLPATPG